MGKNREKGVKLDSPGCSPAITFRLAAKNRNVSEKGATAERESSASGTLTQLIFKKDCAVNGFRSRPLEKGDSESEIVDQDS